jgi:hypothetical protein
MTRTLTIESPECESETCRCPYLAPEGTTEDACVCWGVEGDILGMGRSVVDDGPGTEPPRYSRHVDCPFGARAIAITMTARRASR